MTFYQGDELHVKSRSGDTKAGRARSARRERSLERRRSIRDVATQLFLRHGYVDTTMAEIAAVAGVAVQTLYLAFGSKEAILRAAHDTAVAGAGEDLPVLDRPWVERVRAEPDGRAALALLLEHALAIVERVSPLYSVIQAAAADAEVAELLTETKQQRLATMRVLGEALSTKRGFAAGMSVDHAADLLYATISDEHHRLLVVERGWHVSDWCAWCNAVLTRELFPDHKHPAGRARRRGAAE